MLYYFLALIFPLASHSSRVPAVPLAERYLCPFCLCMQLLRLAAASMPGVNGTFTQALVGSRELVALTG